MPRSSAMQIKVLLFALIATFAVATGTLATILLIRRQARRDRRMTLNENSFLIEQLAKQENSEKLDRDQLLEAGLAIRTNDNAKITAVYVFGKVISFQKQTLVVESKGNLFSVEIPDLVAFRNFVTGEGSVLRHREAEKIIEKGNTVLCEKLEVSKDRVICNRLILYAQ